MGSQYTYQESLFCHDCDSKSKAARQVNGSDTVLSNFVASLAVDKLPYFHFYREGSLISHFAANLTKMNLLRAEIAAQKDSVLSAIFDHPQPQNQVQQGSTQE